MSFRPPTPYLPNGCGTVMLVRGHNIVITHQRLAFAELPALTTKLYEKISTIIWAFEQITTLSYGRYQDVDASVGGHHG